MCCIYFLHTIVLKYLRECIGRCIFRWPFWRNVFPQISHLKGLFAGSSSGENTVQGKASTLILYFSFISLTSPYVSFLQKNAFAFCHRKIDNFNGFINGLLRISHCIRQYCLWGKNVSPPRWILWCSCKWLDHLKIFKHTPHLCICFSSENKEWKYCAVHHNNFYNKKSRKRF